MKQNLQTMGIFRNPFYRGKHVILVNGKLYTADSGEEAAKILKNLEKTKLKVFLPFSIISFLFFTTWLLFNLVLIFGHTIQCLPVYKIFLSGCSIL